MTRTAIRSLLTSSVAVGLLIAMVSCDSRTDVVIRDDGEWNDALSAAIGEAVQDPRYQALLFDRFGIDAANLTAGGCGDFPDITKNSLLDRIVNTNRTVRVGVAVESIPFSFINEATGELDGAAVQMWPFVAEKLSAHYGRPVDFKLIELPVALNDSHTRLATPADPDCRIRDREAGHPIDGPDQVACYDVTGGGFAINASRALVNDFTCSYLPVNLTAVRTRAAESFGTPLTTAAEVFEAVCDPASEPRFAFIQGTIEARFLQSVTEDQNWCLDKTGVAGPAVFTQVERDGTRDALEFAETTEAHLILGTDARLLYTHRTSDACEDCPIVEGILSELGGVAFGTFKPPAE